MELLKKNLLLVQKLLRRDYDWLHINIGYERSGKSTLAIHEALIVDPTFDASRITFTQADFKNAVNKSKPYQAIIADEGAESFMSKDAMRAENVENQKLLTKIGAKRLFVIINVPDFFLLDPYVRGHRVRSMCRVVGRGELAFYSKSHIQLIRRNLENKATIYPEPNFFDDFTMLDKKPGIPGHVWKDYLAKKMAYLGRHTKEDKLRSMADKLLSQTITQKEASKILQIPYTTMRAWVVHKKVKMVKMPSGQKRVPACEVERILKSQAKQVERIKNSYAEDDVW
jgi:hypothetical protein